MTINNIKQTLHKSLHFTFNTDGKNVILRRLRPVREFLNIIKIPLRLMDIQKIASSRLQEVDFNTIPFGKLFSDHMLVCEYEDGHWKEAKIKPYGPFPVLPGMQVFHYGQAVFEGMKAYKDTEGAIWLFRPTDNHKRLNQSCERLDMPAIPEAIFMEGLTELLRLDAGWVPQGEEMALYIRPFMFASGEQISAKPSGRYTFMIITSPVTAYYKGEVKVKIEEKYSRSASGGTGYAKAAGNYAGAFYPARLAQKEGYTQLIWTDAATHSYIEESGTMNIMFRLGNTLVTPPLSDRILAGITRDSILTLARERGLP